MLTLGGDRDSVSNGTWSARYTASEPLASMPVEALSADPVAAAGIGPMTAKGHEDRFPPPRLSDGCGLRKETITGMRLNGRDAPKAAIRALRAS